MIQPEVLLSLKQTNKKASLSDEKRGNSDSDLLLLLLLLVAMCNTQ